MGWGLEFSFLVEHNIFTIHNCTFCPSKWYLWAQRNINVCAALQSCQYTYHNVAYSHLEKSSFLNSKQKLNIYNCSGQESVFVLRKYSKYLYLFFVQKRTRKFIFLNEILRYSLLQYRICTVHVVYIIINFLPPSVKIINGFKLYFVQFYSISI